MKRFERVRSDSNPETKKRAGNCQCDTVDNRIPEKRGHVPTFADSAARRYRKPKNTTPAALELEEFAEAFGLLAAYWDFGVLFVVHFEHVA